MVILCLLLIILPNLNHALPNFVFILTDDQDLTLHSLEFMNKTTFLIANQGITFTNFFVNSPICCPSRSTILTGKYPHNSQVYNNSIDGGCSNSQWQQNHEIATIATVLKTEKNYTTFYAGKYLNQYGTEEAGGVGHIPPGYDWWLGLQGNSRYYNYTLSVNGTGQFFESSYLTDLITKYSLDFLNQKLVTENNFFMMLAPPACHAPFTPASRHQNLFPDLQTPRTLPFNATPADKHWIVQMPPKSLPQDITVLDEIYRNRMRTLQAVDDMIEAVITKLTDIKVLDKTYIIVASDNGFHIGQFTQPWDKRQPYESDIHVPLLIRGPEIPNKILSDFPVSAIDLFPTILDLAQIKATNSDGVSFKSKLFAENEKSYTKSILIEYWGEANSKTISPKCPWSPEDELAECVPEGWCKCQDSKNNTYTCLLEFSLNSKFKFCAFQNGFVEAYNLTQDPLELNNLQLPKTKTNHYLQILNKLKQCSGPNCEINI